MECFCIQVSTLIKHKAGDQLRLTYNSLPWKFSIADMVVSVVAAQRPKLSWLKQERMPHHQDIFDIPVSTLVFVVEKLFRGEVTHPMMGRQLSSGPARRVTDEDRRIPASPKISTQQA
jgi:hypothetical protein